MFGNVFLRSLTISCACCQAGCVHEKFGNFHISLDMLIRRSEKNVQSGNMLFKSWLAHAHFTGKLAMYPISKAFRVVCCVFTTFIKFVSNLFGILFSIVGAKAPLHTTLSNLFTARQDLRQLPRVYLALGSKCWYGKTIRFTSTRSALTKEHLILL